MIKMKCLKCPYRLELVKCVRTPCIECMREGRKTHPFHGNDIAAVCGGEQKDRRLNNTVK